MDFFPLDLYLGIYRMGTAGRDLITICRLRRKSAWKRKEQKDIEKPYQETNFSLWIKL